MYKNKKISCVVLNYNDHLQTKQAICELEKIRIIDYIIIIDNRSTDDSYKLLKDFENNIIKVFCTERNGGYGYGNNFGVKISKNDFNCDFAIICNPDVIIPEETIVNIMDTFLDDNKLAICSGVQINGFTNTMIKNVSWKVPTYGDYLKSSLLLANKIMPSYEGVGDSFKSYVGCVPGAFLIIDIEKFLRCGGYDEDIFLFCEESVLGFRVREAGYKTALLNNSFYYHFHSTSINKSIPNELKKHKMVLGSRLFYIKKYLKASRIKIALAKVIFKISAFEYALYFCFKSYNGK